MGLPHDSTLACRNILRLRLPKGDRKLCLRPLSSIYFMVGRNIPPRLTFDVWRTYVRFSRRREWKRKRGSREKHSSGYSGWFRITSWVINSLVLRNFDIASAGLLRAFFFRSEFNQPDEITTDSLFFDQYRPRESRNEKAIVIFSVCLYECNVCSRISRTGEDSISLRKLISGSSIADRGTERNSGLARVKCDVAY